MYNATKSIFEISHNNSYMVFNLVEIHTLYGGTAIFSSNIPKYKKIIRFFLILIFSLFHFYVEHLLDVK